MSLFINPFLNQRQPRFRVMTACVGFLVVPRSGWEEWRHPFWVLGLGPPWPQRVRVKRREFVRPLDSYILLEPRVPHQVLWEEGRSFALTWLFIEETGQPSLLRRLVQRDGFCNFQDPNHCVEPLIHQIAAEFKTPRPGGDLLSQAALSQIIGLLVCAERKPDGRRQILALGTPISETKERFSMRYKVESYLRTHPQQRILIQDVARHLNLSASSFTHRYRNEAGETFAETRERIRLDKAKPLLLGGTMTIKQIAFEVGYRDHAHFSTRFKRVTGFRPSEFAQQVMPRSVSQPP